jgi:hypothetical protein
MAYGSSTTSWYIKKAFEATEIYVVSYKQNSDQADKHFHPAESNG